MLRSVRRVSSSVCFILCAGLAIPASASAPAVPPDLVPWKAWVLEGKAQQLCPGVQGEVGNHRCRWPSTLSLALDASGGTFSQRYHLLAPGFVVLPGGDAHPAAEVRLDGRAAAVHRRMGRLGLEIPVGTHTVSGRFSWDRLPELLFVPAATGLLALSVEGQAIPFPGREADGRVFLRQQREEGRAEDRLDLLVHRKLTDDVPLRVTTRIEVRVSGKNREVLVGPVLLAGGIPTGLDAPLPARIEADGRLRLQVRPGKWTITIESRQPGKADALVAPKLPAPWPGSEVWVFEARRDLRLVEVGGAAAVDPKQTRLPQGWKGLPAYRLAAGETLELLEQRRGDSDPAPDQLQLQRQWWLDFDGEGVTIQDRITGVMHSGWRLTMGESTQLGRVAVDGREQLITRLAKDKPAGVEVRRRQLQVLAESRREASPSHLPAVGWNHDFQQVGGVLHLPPGWRLLQVTGVDSASPDDSVWLESWTLLDLFLVLVLTLALGRLFGRGWGALALVTLALILPDEGPVWIWAFVLAFEALHRALPSGVVRKIAWGLRGASLLILVLWTVDFGVTQVRVGMYPMLARPWTTIGGAYSGSGWDAGVFGASANAPAGSSALDEAPLAPPAPEAFEQDVFEAKAGVGRAKRSASDRVAQQGRLISLGSSKSWSKARSLSYQVDPDAVVQTGPGLPRWTWSDVNLSWSGPVSRAQTVRLWLLGPKLNFVLSLLRVGLLALLVLCVLGLFRAGSPLRRVIAPGGAGVTAALLVGLLLAPVPARAEIPSTELLQELGRRLTKPPACAPTCASVGRLHLQVTARSLALRMEISAAVATAVPLPGDARHWLPSVVTVDGRPAVGLARQDGKLWLLVEPGSHQVALSGTLPPRETVQIPLPLRPAQTSAKIEGWTLDGLHEDGVADASLQLSRIRQEGSAHTDLEAGTLPAFVRIERHLHLGLDWTLDTTFVRLTPADSAVVLEVPLLTGERPTTDGLRIEGGKVLVNLAAGTSRFAWQSVLEPRDALVLTASETTEWIEVWRLDASPVWHVEASGIPPVHTQADVPVRQWQPWPGESVSLSVVRPAATEGAHFTIDRSALVVTPGRRVTDTTLELTIRASRGEPHTLKLPEGAALQRVRIDGEEQPVRASGRAVTLPLRPGKQQIDLEWRETRPASLHYKTSVIELGAPSVNASLTVKPSAGRWTLLAWGPLAGPAVLFWSLLLMILLVAVVLGRIPLAPLSTRHWALLGIGLSQSSVWVAALVAGFLLFMGWRQKAPELSRNWFNLRQILIVGWAVVAMIALLVGVSAGLLGEPEMQITGNGSSQVALEWFVDRTANALPAATIVSVPMLVYRLLMLAWALWLAVALVRWVQWIWDCFREGGLWMSRPVKKASSGMPDPGGELKG